MCYHSTLTAGSRAAVHPVARQPRDVKPLSWSAATGVAAVLSRAAGSGTCVSSPLSLNPQFSTLSLEQQEL